MPKFPDPPQPEALAALLPPIIEELPPQTRLSRIYFRGGHHGTEWNVLRRYGPTDSRFDHHVPPPRVQDRAILYAARLGVTCFAEVFQDKRAVYTKLNDPWLVVFSLRRAVRLLNLTGNWPTRAGCSMAISSGQRGRARAWSRAIYEAYPDVEGLWYASSMHANKVMVALYDRAGDAIAAAPVFHRALADRAMGRRVRKAADALGYEVM